MCTSVQTHSQACTWFHRHIPMDTQIHSLFTDIPTWIHRITHMPYAWLHTHSLSHTHICNDTLTWMSVVTQTHSKAHTQFYIHTILHIYAQLSRHISMHIRGDTLLYTHTHTHSQQAHTLASVGMEPGSRNSVLCHSSGQQMPLLSLLSPDVTIMVGRWIPLSVPSNTVFLWLLPHYSSPYHHTKEARLWQGDRGQSLGAQAPDQECWSTLRLHFSVCR